MSHDRELKLGAFLPAAGHHVAAWRHPSARADGGVNLKHYVQLAQSAERATMTEGLSTFALNQPLGVGHDEVEDGLLVARIFVGVAHVGVKGDRVADLQHVAGLADTNDNRPTRDD
jgi:hypothetical protein